MVFSDPNPYVLCPRCVQVNYLKLDGGNGLVLIRRWTDTVRQCCNCGHMWTYFKDSILPINKYRYVGLGYYFYLLLNIKAGLIYVGRTTRSLHERMWDYWSYCQNWKYWQTQTKRPSAYSMEIVRAMVESGFNSFEMILLESGSSTGEWRERHWIFKLNSIDPKIGYNRRAW